jgi:hypothetical protein
MKIQTNFKLVEFNHNLELNEFYDDALQRGYINNSSQSKMIDCFKHERAWKVWILYENQTPCGSVGCHSLDIMGPNAYRICARTCFFPEYNLNKGLIAKKNEICQHQHVVPQFYMIAGIEWAGLDKDFYITTNNSKEASNRKVHTVWAPILAEMGILEKMIEQNYRGHMQTFWKLNTNVFLESINSNHRWLLRPS